MYGGFALLDQFLLVLAHEVFRVLADRRKYLFISILTWMKAELSYENKTCRLVTYSLASTKR